MARHSVLDDDGGMVVVHRRQSAVEEPSMEVGHTVLVAVVPL